MDSDDVEYDMLVSECQDLIDQANMLRNENANQLKLVDVAQQAPEVKQSVKMENIEAVWEELIREKKTLEDQWTDVTLDLRKKQRQLEDFSHEMRLTKERIDEVSGNLKEKEDFVKSLRDQYE